MQAGGFKFHVGVRKLSIYKACWKVLHDTACIFACILGNRTNYIQKIERQIQTKITI